MFIFFPFSDAFSIHNLDIHPIFVFVLSILRWTWRGREKNSFFKKWVMENPLSDLFFCFLFQLLILSRNHKIKKGWRREHSLCQPLERRQWRDLSKTELVENQICQKRNLPKTKFVETEKKFRFGQTPPLPGNTLYIDPVQYPQPKCIFSRKICTNLHLSKIFLSSSNYLFHIPWRAVDPRISSSINVGRSYISYSYWQIKGSNRI